MMSYYVEIFHILDNHVERRMGPMGKSCAERVKGGVSINLNFEEWGVRIVEASA